VQAATKPLLTGWRGCRARPGRRRRRCGLVGELAALGLDVGGGDRAGAAGVAGECSGAVVGLGVAAAQLRRAKLQAEVAEMQANRDEWVKAGMLAKLSRCNPGNRPCIRVNEAAGAFESKRYTGYRVIQGY